MLPPTQLEDHHTGKMSVEAMEAKINELNRFDTMIYERIKNTLFGKIKRQVWGWMEVGGRKPVFEDSNPLSPKVSVEQEMEQIHAARAEAAEYCEKLRKDFASV